MCYKHKKRKRSIWACVCICAVVANSIAEVPHNYAVALPCAYHFSHGVATFVVSCYSAGLQCSCNYSLAVCKTGIHQHVSSAGMQHVPYCSDVCAIMHMQSGTHRSAPLSGPTMTPDLSLYTQVSCSCTSLHMTDLHVLMLQGDFYNDMRDDGTDLSLDVRQFCRDRNISVPAPKPSAPPAYPPGSSNAPYFSRSTQCEPRTRSMEDTTFNDLFLRVGAFLTIQSIPSHAGFHTAELSVHRCSQHGCGQSTLHGIVSALQVGQDTKTPHRCQRQC